MKANITGTSAVAAFVFIGPLRGYSFDFGDTMFVALLGTMFGIVAGAVAGASETGEHEEYAKAPVQKVAKTKPSASMHPAHPGV